MTTRLETYAREAAEGSGCADFSGAEIFAKILTQNDDAGRHGVLIPTEAYLFFPDLPIIDPQQNATALFAAYDAVARQPQILGWKYYQRYPERRVTRLSSKLNDVSHGRRLLVIVRTKSGEGVFAYVADVSVEGVDARFGSLVEMMFGASIPAQPGAFVRLPVDVREFRPDDALNDLLARFDKVACLDWIVSHRTGTTGIGHTFEQLVGVKENNDKRADFRGIEVKCKLAREVRAYTSGKINLFQQAPVWCEHMTAIERLRKIGHTGADGGHSCYSQVTTTPNNLELWLQVPPPPSDVHLYKSVLKLGAWGRDVLAERLAEKHSRAIFVKALARGTLASTQYKYTELVYCERPDVNRFIDMVQARQIVFEFTMTERPAGRVRNHGYPWRLVDERLLDQLFALQVKLRG